MTRYNQNFLQAAYKGDLAGVVQARLDGADVEAVHTQTGLNALHIATGTDNLLLARYLVEQCNASFKPDSSGRWPTVIAAECGVSTKMSDYIVEKEAEFLKRKPTLG